MSAAADNRKGHSTPPMDKHSSWCPLCCAFRTYGGHRATSEMGQQRTHAPQQTAFLLDRLL